MKLALAISAVSLIFALIMLVAALVIGLGIAFVGLALHHDRRRREFEHTVAAAKAGHPLHETVAQVAEIVKGRAPKGAVNADRAARLATMK